MTFKTLFHLAAGMSLCCMVAGSARADQIKWAASYNKAKKAAKESGRLMMINFWTEW